MKKIFCYISVFIICFFTWLEVSAKEYNTMELIPVTESFDVNCEMFNYKGINYNGSTITFSSIENITDSSLPISISIGLFDQDEKNLGIINYCSNNDYDSDFSNLKLESKKAIPYTVKVKEAKYLAEGKSFSDVKYIAVMNDNEYCKVGGAQNSVGKTLTEISSGGEVEVNKINEFLSSIPRSIIIFVIVSFVLYVVSGILVSLLYRDIYRDDTSLTWVPVCNFYLVVNLAYGKIVSIVFIVIFGIFAIFRWLIPIYISYSILGLTFIVLIIKIVTENYNLLVLEPNRIKKYLNGEDLEPVNNNSNVSNNNFNDSNSFINSSIEEGNNKENRFIVSNGSNSNDGNLNNQNENSNSNNGDSDFNKFY